MQIALWLARAGGAMPCPQACQQLETERRVAMPTMQTYKARVWPFKKGSMVDVQVQARNSSEAKQLLERQYGKGNVQTIPARV